MRNGKLPEVERMNEEGNGLKDNGLEHFLGFTSLHSIYAHYVSDHLLKICDFDMQTADIFEGISKYGLRLAIASVATFVIYRSGRYYERGLLANNQEGLIEDEIRRQTTFFN